MPDRGALGASFALELSEAIERATAERRAVDPLAWVHDGADLRHAVERQLFIQLVNNPTVRSARDGRGKRVRVVDELEQKIVELVAPATAPVISTGARARSAVRPLARRLPRQVSRTETAVRGRPFWLVTHHPKFLRFAATIVDALGRDLVGVFALSPEVVAAARTLGVVARDLNRPRRHSGVQGFGPRSHLADLFVDLREELERVGATVVVVFEGNAPSDEVVAAAARSVGIGSVCVQHGWAALPNVGFRNMHHSAVATWGDGFAELLQPYNPEQRFVVTGDPALEAAQSNGPLTRKVGDRSGILFALQTVAPTISRDAMHAFLALISGASEAMPDVPMLVREHPGHPLEHLGLTLPSSPNVLPAPPGDVDLVDALTAASAVASISSTTLLEGIALLRPAVVFEIESGTRYSPDIENWNAGVQVGSVPEGVAALRRLVTADGRAALLPGMRSFRDHFFAGTPSDASIRVAQLVEQFASATASG